MDYYVLGHRLADFNCNSMYALEDLTFDMQVQVL